MSAAFLPFPPPLTLRTNLSPALNLPSPGSESVRWLSSSPRSDPISALLKSSESVTLLVNVLFSPVDVRTFEAAENVTVRLPVTSSVWMPVTVKRMLALFSDLVQST